MNPLSWLPRWLPEPTCRQSPNIDLKAISSGRILNTDLTSRIFMLKLTKKADYGLMALKYLAEHPETPALSAKDVADAYGIPAQLLAKILQLLTKNGLLKSHAGMNGGYALARDARAISAFEVIHAIDGPFFITSCMKGT